MLKKKLGQLGMTYGQIFRFFGLLAFGYVGVGLGNEHGWGLVSGSLNFVFEIFVFLTLPQFIHFCHF